MQNVKGLKFSVSQPLPSGPFIVLLPKHYISLQANHATLLYWQVHGATGGYRNVLVD